MTGCPTPFLYRDLESLVMNLAPSIIIPISPSLSLTSLPSLPFSSPSQGAPKPPVSSPPVFRCDYNVYSTFQSHEPEFDYLKSLEIEEKINQICWVKQSGSSLFLLTTNGECGRVMGTI